MKEALGKTWQGVLGFGRKSKEELAKRKDEIAARAQVAGQSISQTSSGECSRYRTFYNVLSGLFWFVIVRIAEMNILYYVHLLLTPLRAFAYSRHYSFF